MLSPVGARTTAGIAPGLYGLLGALAGVNAFVWHPHPEQHRPGEPVLFDCGWPWSARDLAAGLAAHGCRPADIRTIAITHHDLDHTGGLARLQSVSSARVVAHRREAQSIGVADWRRLPCQSRPTNLAGAIATALGSRWPYQPIRIIDPVEDGDELSGGWRTVYTPGHTAGHASYFLPSARVLVAGDALGTTPWGRLRAPHPGYAEDGAQARSSIRRLAALEPDIVCFGHGRTLRNAAPILRRFAARL